MTVIAANFNRAIELPEHVINELRGLLMFGDAAPYDVALRMGISEPELWQLVDGRECNQPRSPQSW